MCFLLSIILPFQSADAHVKYTPDQFWEDYEGNKLVTNVVQHVRSISTRLDTDTLERLEFKKASALWFLATGGKYGFRKTAATSAEKDIMINALIFGAMLHRVSHADEILHLIDVRRDAKIETEDDLVSAHMMEAQRIITATQIMLVSSSQSINKRIQELFNNEYMATVPPSKNIKPETAEWQQEAELFSNIFTVKFDEQTKQVFKNLKLSFNGSKAYFGFKKPKDEALVFTFRNLILKNCMSCLENEEDFTFYSEHEHDADDSDSEDENKTDSCCDDNPLAKMPFCVPVALFPDIRKLYLKIEKPNVEKVEKRTRLLAKKN